MTAALNPTIADRCYAANMLLRQEIEEHAAVVLDVLTRDFARARVRLRLPPYAISPCSNLRLPRRFECPECGGRLNLEVDEWGTEDGLPTPGGFRVLCEADTLAEQAAWSREETYGSGHRLWQSDWQGVTDSVGRWMVRNVRVHGDLRRLEPFRYPELHDPLIDRLHGSVIEQTVRADQAVELATDYAMVCGELSKGLGPLDDEWLTLRDLGLRLEALAP